MPMLALTDCILLVVLFMHALALALAPILLYRFWGSREYASFQQ